jgi:hypothetical protein
MEENIKYQYYTSCTSSLSDHIILYGQIVPRLLITQIPMSVGLDPSLLLL